MLVEFHLDRLDPNEPRPLFDCGNADLNDYFIENSIRACNELIAVSYALYKGDEVVAYYCVSNDAIRREDTSLKGFRLLRERLSPSKRYPSMPAVKIGRFAVSKQHAGNKIGSRLMDAIKYSFTHGNKTGCRFIIVDAYQDAIRFYERNGFEFLSSKDEGKDTRLMYYDLILFRE